MVISGMRTVSGVEASGLGYLETTSCRFCSRELGATCLYIKPSMY